MLLPYFFDLIPEKIGGLFIKLFGWRPEGKKVVLCVDESGDPSLFRKIINGSIVQINLNESGKPNDAIIQLDTPLNYNGKTTTHLFASPRFRGHGLYRLIITWSVVSIFPYSTKEKPHKPLWKDMIGIALLKLRKP